MPEKSEERRNGAARFVALAEERHQLETRAEGEMSMLLQTLQELRDLDERQRRLAHHAVVSRQALKTNFSGVIAGWLSARLGGEAGYMRRVVVPLGFRGKRLSELDPLSRRPPRDEKGA